MIATAMTMAPTKSTVAQNGGHHRVLATNRLCCCQRSLRPWPASPGHDQPGRAGHRRRGDDDEDGGDAGLDDDDPRPPVGDAEPDVDRRDQHEPDCVDGRLVEPEEGQRRRRLQAAPHQTPGHRCAHTPDATGGRGGGALVGRRLPGGDHERQPPGRARAAICSARKAASLPTQPSNADPRVCCQLRPTV